MSENINKIKKEIAKLKKEKDAVILAHNYQIPDIQELGDYLGDSLALAKISTKLKEKFVVFCGVRFMAETVKILAPEKKVILPVIDAGCPLADTVNADQLKELKKQHPDAWVVSYVNTSAEVKALSDVCCTSSNAVTVVKNVPTKKIIFTPDKNLGWWVAKNVPDKELILWPGYCIVHEQFSLDDLKRSKQMHPDAQILAHPECRSEILENSDFVLSTAGMLEQVKSSKAKKFIIGTEEGLIYQLKKQNPDKIFYSLGNARTCINMKKTALKDVLRAFKKEEFRIELDQAIIDKAKVALERMVSYV